MSVAVATVAQWLGGALAFDTLIDVRSPAEFAEDHLPGAVNWPVLNDEERARVGTIYKQVSTFEARKLGAALVSRRIADLLESQVAGKQKGWRPLVYCWRGGQRSGSLSLVLNQVGFKTHQLAGGYKAFRGQVIADTATLAPGLRLHLIRGRTGSGKTRLLEALAAQGAQVLDLEALAAHRGSVLGGWPGQAQPSQKAFETQLWARLRQFEPQRRVFLESESRRIGALQLPDALVSCMKAAVNVTRVEMPMAARVDLLLKEYAALTEAPELFCARIEALTSLQSRETVAHWQALARSGSWAELLPELLARHYDPLYDRHAPSSEGVPADRLNLADDGESSLAAAAQSLLAANQEHQR
jgi:tRNA 2-selenouridine synthase